MVSDNYGPENAQKKCEEDFEYAPACKGFTNASELCSMATAPIGDPQAPAVPEGISVSEAECVEQLERKTCRKLGGDMLQSCIEFIVDSPGCPQVARGTQCFSYLIANSIGSLFCARLAEKDPQSLMDGLDLFYFIYNKPIPQCLIKILDRKKVEVIERRAKEWWQTLTK